MQNFTPGFFPQLAEHHFTDWNSVYRMVPDLTTGDLRKIYRENNIHIYSETDDAVSVCSHLLMLHASSSGEKKITLPKSMKVVDSVTGTVIGENVQEFKFTLSKGETALFELQSF
jgi:hypothetical protein